MRLGKAGSWNSKRVRLAIVAMTVAIVLLFSLELPKPFPKILEFSFYISWLVLLSAYEPLRQLLRSLPRPQRRFLIAITAVLLIAQVINKTRRTFPFIAWQMYSTSQPDAPVFFEYIGTCADGRELAIDTQDVFRSQGRAVRIRLRRQWIGIKNAVEDARRSELDREFRALLTATISRFNEQHPESRVRSVRLVRCSMPRPSPGRELPVTRRSVAEFSFE